MLLTAATGSHALTLLPFASALRRTHDVTFVVTPAVVPYVSNRGAEVIVGDAPDAAATAAAWTRFERAPAGEAAVIANREVFGRFNTRALLPAVERACRDLQPVLLLHEAAEFAGPIAATRAGVTHAQVAISRAQAEFSSLELAAPELEAIEAGVTAAIARSPYLTRFPAVLDFSPYPRTLRYREAAVPTPISTGSSVYVTFGTVAPTVGRQAPHRAAVEAALAATDGDTEVVVTTGAPINLGPLPARVRVEAWLDQDTVLSSAAAVVCHGGSGTVIAALRYGVPMVIIPMFADHFGNGRQVAEAGAGLVLERRGAAADLTVISHEDQSAVASLLGRVLTEPGFRAAARRVASDLALPDTIERIAAELVRER